MYTVKEKIQHTLTNAMAVIKAESDISTFSTVDKINLILEALTNKQKALLVVWSHIHNGVNEIEINFSGDELLVLQDMIDNTTPVRSLVISQHEHIVFSTVSEFLKGEYE